MTYRKGSPVKEKLTRRLLPAGSALVAAAIVTGCIGEATPIPAERYYRVESTLPAGPDGGHAKSLKIVLEPVEAHGIYVESALLHRSASASAALEQYPYSSWSEPPDAMLGDVLLSDLRAAFGAMNAQTGAVSAAGQVRLKMRLRRLDQVIDGANAQAEFAATYTAIDAKGEPLFVFDFDRRQAASGPSPKEFVEAVDTLVAQADRELIEKLRAEDR